VSAKPTLITNQKALRSSKDEEMMMMKSPLEDLRAFWFVISVGLALTVMIFVVLVYQIFWPKIITYPWKEEEEEEEEEQVNQTVIFAASYNPPHHGHVRILEYLSRRFAKVIAVVGFNPDKEYLVKPEQRAELLRDMLKSTTATNVKVEGELIRVFVRPISFAIRLNRRSLI